MTAVQTPHPSAPMVDLLARYCAAVVVGQDLVVYSAEASLSAQFSTQLILAKNIWTTQQANMAFADILDCPDPGPPPPSPALQIRFDFDQNRNVFALPGDLSDSPRRVYEPHVGAFQRLATAVEGAAPMPNTLRRPAYVLVHVVHPARPPSRHDALAAVDALVRGLPTGVDLASLPLHLPFLPT